MHLYLHMCVYVSLNAQMISCYIVYIFMAEALD